MNKVLIGFNILLAAAVIYLFVRPSGGKEEVKKAEVKMNAAFTGEKTKGELRVAYVNIDSLNQKYELFKDEAKRLEGITQSIQKELQDAEQTAIRKSQNLQRVDPTVLTEREKNNIMSEYGRLPAKVRAGHGKGVARQLRREGLTPAVLYGQGGENVSLAIDPLLFGKATDPARNYNTVYRLDIEQDGAAAQTVTCMVVDYQKDSVRDRLLHVDFMRVDPDKQVQRKIPVSYVGRAAGVMIGGRLKTFRRIVKVSAKPFELPVELTVDLSPLDAGQYLRIKDMSLPGTTFLENPEAPLAFIEMPKAKKEEEAPAAGGKKAAAPAKK